MEISTISFTVSCILISFLLSLRVVVFGDFPSTLEGPSTPFTAPLDNDTLSWSTLDLPDTDPRVKRTVSGSVPEQIALSLSSNYDSVWISWITGDYQIGDDITPLDPTSVISAVTYGVVGMPMSSVAIGSSVVYSQFYASDGAQNYSSGIVHHVQLAGLEPATMYQYQCGDLSSSVSDLFFFKTMPLSSPQHYPRRIAVAGDLGLTYNTSQTLSYLLATHPDLFVLVGGVAYSDLYTSNGTPVNTSSFSNPPSETYQARWDYWGRFMQPLTASVPTMVAAGVHEIERQANDVAFVAYTTRFAFPSTESALYYSFNAGGVHFVMLTPYISYDKESDQYKWLERDLEDVDRNVTPWLVVVWYPPWYSTFEAHYREAECMRLVMEELLYSHSVDIVFNAHVHAYERSNRVYNYSLDPCGPVYITLGTGGAAEDVAVTHADDPGHCPDLNTTSDGLIGALCPFNYTAGSESANFCRNQQPEFSAYRESSFGHGSLEVKNETHALWSWNRNQDNFETAADIVYVVREPIKCLLKTR